MRRQISFIFLLSLALFNSQANSQGEQFREYLNSDLHKSQMKEVLLKLPPVVFQNCPNLGSQNGQTIVLKPVSFGQDGTPNDGAWKEKLPVSGCGNDTIINVIFFVNAEHKLQILVTNPGETHASPTLEHDAMAYALVASQPTEKPECKSFYVTNTKFLGHHGEPVEGASIPPWDELWTVNRCGTKADVTMHFIPDKTGTTIATNVSETKFYK